MVIKENNVEFKGMGEMLVEMRNLDSCEKFVMIPALFPDGTEIKKLGCGFCKGNFSTIVIPRSVTTVCAGAFQFSCVKEVVWSPTCSKIPHNCFYNSSIEEIIGIEHITRIDMAAFLSSKIKNIKWPDRCKVIPRSCFYDSQISELSNIEHVSLVSEAAFSLSKLKEIIWPSGCNAIPDLCFSFSSIQNIANINHITSIGRGVFSYAKLDGLDLSATAVCTIGDEAFLGMDPERVSKPYYVPEDEFLSAFGS